METGQATAPTPAGSEAARPSMKQEEKEEEEKEEDEEEKTKISGSRDCSGGERRKRERKWDSS